MHLNAILRRKPPPASLEGHRTGTHIRAIDTPHALARETKLIQAQLVQLDGCIHASLSEHAADALLPYLRGGSCCHLRCVLRPAKRCSYQCGIVAASGLGFDDLRVARNVAIEKKSNGALKRVENLREAFRIRHCRRTRLRRGQKRCSKSCAVEILHAHVKVNRINLRLTEGCCLQLRHRLPCRHGQGVWKVHVKFSSNSKRRAICAGSHCRSAEVRVAGCAAIAQLPLGINIWRE